MRFSFSYAGACLIASMFLCGEFAPCCAAEPGKDSAKSDSERVERLIRQLRSDDFQQRVRASEELVAIGAPALEPLRRVAVGEDPDLKRWAEQCIPQIERNAKIAACVKDLLEAHDPKVRADATDYLVEVGPAAAAAVPALLLALDDTDWRVRERAVVTLKRIGPEAKPAVPKLVQMLRDQKTGEKQRWTVVEALGGIGRNAEEAIPALLWVLEAESARLKKIAALTLGEIGGNHPKVVPALVKTLKHPECFVRGNAAAGLGMLAREPDTCVPALLELLKQRKRVPLENDERRSILASLVSFGADARRAVPAIVEIAKDTQEERMLRKAAIRTLGEFGPIANDAVSYLEEAIKTDPQVEAEAIEALQAIQKPAK